MNKRYQQDYDIVDIILTDEQLNYLEKVFSRPNYKPDVDIKDIMYIEGQRSVIEWLHTQRLIQKNKQNDAYGVGYV